MPYLAFIFMVVSVAYAGYWCGRRVELDRWVQFLQNNAKHLDHEGLLEAHRFLRGIVGE